MTESFCELDDAAEAQSDVKRETLTRYRFTDLYLSRDARFLNSARGLYPVGDHAQTSSSQVVALPPDLQADAAYLLLEIERAFADHRDYEFVMTYDAVQYRCALIGAVGIPAGQNLHWCIRPIGMVQPVLTGLSLSAETIVSLKKAGSFRGLVIVSGFFGSGKSSTATAALLDWVTTQRQSAITFEDPPEFPIMGSFDGGGIIHQVPYKAQDLPLLSSRSKRWAPRFVMFGEIRDGYSALEALQTAVSGPTVVCTIHALDVIQALAAIVRFASHHIPAEEARQMLAASLRLIIHQDLVGGRPVVRKFSLMHQDASAIRNKIESGRFLSLRDDLGDTETAASGSNRHL